MMPLIVVLLALAAPALAQPTTDQIKRVASAIIQLETQLDYLGSEIAREGSPSVRRVLRHNVDDAVVDLIRARQQLPPGARPDVHELVGRAARLSTFGARVFAAIVAELWQPPTLEAGEIQPYPPPPPPYWTQPVSSPALWDSTANVPSAGRARVDVALLAVPVPQVADWIRVPLPYAYGEPDDWYALSGTGHLWATDRTIYVDLEGRQRGGVVRVHSPTGLEYPHSADTCARYVGRTVTDRGTLPDGTPYWVVEDGRHEAILRYWRLADGRILRQATTGTWTAPQTAIAEHAYAIAHAPNPIALQAILAALVSTYPPAIVLNPVPWSALHLRRVWHPGDGSLYLEVDQRAAAPVSVTARYWTPETGETGRHLGHELLAPGRQTLALEWPSGPDGPHAWLEVWLYTPTGRVGAYLDWHRRAE